MRHSYTKPRKPKTSPSNSQAELPLGQAELPQVGWRVHVDNPAEVQHTKIPKASVWRRLDLRVEYLSQAELGPLMHNALYPTASNDFSPAYDALYPAADESASHGRLSTGMRLLRVALSLFVLLPLSVMLIIALARQLHGAGDKMDLNFWLSTPVWFTLMGALCFVCLILLRFFNPAIIFFYVLGHELTHAIAAILCLGKINAFKFDFDGGYIETNKDNLFIALSPYFVPLWMLLWMLVLAAINYVVPFVHYDKWFYAGFGFWWLFHLYWTLWVIPREQPDMLENGLLFSSLIILIANIGVLVLILRSFGVIHFSSFGEELFYSAQLLRDTFSAAYAAIAHYIEVLAR